MSQEGRLFAVAAGLLAEADRADRLSRLLTAAAILALAWGEPSGLARALWAGTALLGGAELVLALRTGFDARLLRGLAAEAEAGRLDLAAFDAAMGRLGLMAPAKAGRAADARCRGAVRLLRGQGACLAAQLVLAVAAALA